MATYDYGLKYTIYNYGTDDLTEIPEAGEKRYFDTIITGSNSVCHVIGDGSSQINQLPFVSIVDIQTASNVNLETLRIQGNRVIVTNTHSSSITVNIGTTGSPINRTLNADEIVELRFDGSNWLQISKNYSVPIGTILAWHKTFTGCPDLPDNFVECSGQVLSDSESPFNGETIPDLNGDARFLRGAATSGTEQADAFQGHYHDVRMKNTDGVNSYPRSGDSGGSTISGNNLKAAYTVQDDGTNGTPRIATETRPINMSVVWIIRIK